MIYTLLTGQPGKINKSITTLLLGVGLLLVIGGGQAAQALDLDWSGQFRAESHTIFNYTMDGSDATRVPDAARVAAGGYVIPAGGAHRADFQTLFLRLRPKLVVNDNIFIKSEWWAGSPVFGFFGGAAPYSNDQRQFNSNFSRGSWISAQRLWAELQTDVGTIKLGRAPLHWGLGVVWNSGDGLSDRYMSTGDVIGLTARFGSFTVAPSVIKYTMGNAVGGNCTVSGANCTATTVGGSSVSDYSFILKYENADDDYEIGLNFIRRLSEHAQDPTFGYLGIGNVADTTQLPARSVFNTWDIYLKKKLGPVTVAAEMPITQGEVGEMQYRSFAIAGELNWKLGDSWDLGMKMGRAPGQPNINPGARADQLKAFYFHPNYHLGMILFNYQLANFSQLNSLNNGASSESNLKSPFFNPVVNAQYLTLGGSYRANDRWKLSAGYLFAQAPESATTGKPFFNTWNKKYYNNTAAVEQGKSLGHEFDLNATYNWDDALSLGFDGGLFLPGSYFEFSNVAGSPNKTSAVVAFAIKAGVSF